MIDQAQWEAANEVQRETDAALVAAITGQGEGQNALAEMYSRPLRVILRRRRITKEDAEDLLQRTLLRAIEKIRAGGLDDPSNLGGFLYRTACGLARDYWRRDVRRRQRHDSDPEMLNALPARGLTPEEQVEQADLSASMRKVMEGIPVARDRDLLERLYVREEPPTEVCASMRMTEHQFNVMLSRARQRFGKTFRTYAMLESVPEQVLP